MGEPIIRPMHPNDALDMQEVRTRPNARWGTMQLPTLPLEDVQAWCNTNPNGFTLVAEVDGKAVGSTGIFLGSNRQRHLAGLGMAVHDDFQGQGLGKKLMTAVLDLADNWLGLERLELEVYTDNARAIQLYHNFGFIEEGTLRKFSLREGQWVDALCMARLRGRAAHAASGPTILPDALRIDPTVPGIVTQTVPPAPPRGRLPAALTYRAVRPDDSRALHALYLQPDVLASMNQQPALQEDEIRKELSGGIPRGHHRIIAELGGRLIGVAYLAQMLGRRANSSRLTHFATDQDWRRHGVGDTLLDFLTGLADQELGVRQMETEIPAHATAALLLAHKHGFSVQAVKRAAMISADGFVDLIHLVREGKLPA